MQLSDERKEQSIQLVDELKTQMSDVVFDFMGSKAEVEAFLKDLKMRVNRITVDEFCTEAEAEAPTD